MKKKIGIISALLVVVIVAISTILLTNKDDDKSINLDNGIAYYYQNESGDYTQESYNNTWTTGYVLNIGKSSCNDITNPKDILDWDSVNKTVLMSTNKNNNCKLYFDKLTPGQTYTAEDFFKAFAKNGGLSGQGNLLQHTTSLPNSAGDDGYRYSGNNPNNFICFGPGSESYNNGTSIKCHDENLYRIIGYVPVELSTGTTTNLIKVIKSEYATANDLEIPSKGTPESDSHYANLKRVKELPKDGFRWNDIDEDDSINTWQDGSLYNALNINDNSFINKLGNWANIIENVKWNVGPNPAIAITSQVMYNSENDEEQGASTQVSAKIGLMYPSDYGFASSQKSWTTQIYNYNTDENQKNNWLYNAVYEWTISRDGSPDGAINVANEGHLGSDNGVYNVSYGVRPVFYLKSDVKLVNDNNIDGSMDHPFRLA